MCQKKTPIVVIGLLLFLSSCSLFRPSGDPRHAAVFKSYPNDLASIRLELKENSRFDYYMAILPEIDENSMQDQQEESQEKEILEFRGRWYNDDSHYFLRFRRKNKPDLYALVSPGYEPPTQVTVVDERILRFPLNETEIVIWGIRCFKQNPEAEDL